ncbi:MAG: hypothetical protein F6K36_19785 [Symploca sp. SIO3C6]|uniref:Uncharacterized protein n=1 Tax=Symploca sp. SIO1C4 TaxID=2607765 RepID=A0A6B3NDU9_9CYAN|nr:hypothetical protein [Symploca sp. SIO3C6]NER27318.1 hypothetical protein [Symploca sp. SIO1C4]NET04095.1 hypothetical protein [Symploca sp. SIO2B6]NET50991.1 hypothetical protein [Merismopedia sp. SIO2A8]
MHPRTYGTQETITAEHSYSCQRDQENKRYFQRRIRKQQPAEIAAKMLKTMVFHGQGMPPRRFCRRWFGLEAINEYGQPLHQESYIVMLESEHGYREKCINLIARILKIKPNTIHRWGKGVEFDKIPPDKRQQYEMYLGYVDTLRMITTSLAGLEGSLLEGLLHRLEIS